MKNKPLFNETYNCYRILHMTTRGIMLYVVNVVSDQLTAIIPFKSCFCLY